MTGVRQTKHGELVWLAVVTAIGAALRIGSPGRIALWRDEVQSINIASLPTTRAMLSFLYHHESHPPLYYALLRAFGPIAGGVRDAAAQLALVGSIASIPTAWWLGRELRVRGAGIAAAAVIAASVPLVLFSVQSRPYSLLSLLVLAGMAALLRSLRSRSWGWKALWAALVLGLLYLHHVGVLVVMAELTAAGLMIRRLRIDGRQRRDLGITVAFVAIGALPDLLLLLHQAGNAGYPAPQPMTIWQPPIEFLQIALRLPAEATLAVLGAVVLAVGRNHRRSADFRADASVELRRVVGLAGVIVVGLLIVASYRSSFLAMYVVLAISPLLMVCTATVVAGAVERGQRLIGAVWIEATVAALAVSGLFGVGFAKTNTDLVAGYISAESSPGDFLVLVPGAAGPSLNYYLTSPVSQLDYPYFDAITIYRFDHDFDRIVSPRTLKDAVDSIEGVCSAGRALWYVTPWFLDHGRVAPIQLSSDSFGGLGQAEMARANFLRRAMLTRFGPPVATARPDSTTRGLELLSVERFQRDTMEQTAVAAARCHG